MEKISMSKKSNLTIQEAFDLFIRKCRIKNLTDLSISSYEKKMVHFYEFVDKNEPIETVTKNMVDNIFFDTDNLPIQDIAVNDSEDKITVYLSDGTLFTIQCEIYGNWWLVGV